MLTFILDALELKTYFQFIFMPNWNNSYSNLNLQQFSESIYLISDLYISSSKRKMKTNSNLLLGI